MAYDLHNRFPRLQKYYTILDPGAYQYENPCESKQNKFPFLSNTARNTKPGATIWTHQIYDATISKKIPNCTAFMTKLPRFPHEALNKDIEKIVICECGAENICECSNVNNEEITEKQTATCQGKLRKRLYIGPPPRSIQSDYQKPIISKRKLTDKVDSPPFYDAKVNESTAFYQGCKWSKWTSKRCIKPLEAKPGPADYNMVRKIYPEQICAETFRHHRRKKSKQLRYIELIQQRNLLQNHPGPASYSPNLPSGIKLNYLGPKAHRFPSHKYEIKPGPTHYQIHRTFDPPENPVYPCQAKLPDPACFGIKAQRFTPRFEEGPSPASYHPNYKSCLFVNCSHAPFGSTTERFKEKYIITSDKESEDQKDELDAKICPNQTWVFKSKTMRMMPLKKKLNEPSPADLPQPMNSVKGLKIKQYLAPFHSSEGRFQPWHNWVPVHGSIVTPGPGYYGLETPECVTITSHGPLQRTPRFSSRIYNIPAPNEYKVGGGIETILSTHNQRLKNNIERQGKLFRKPPKTSKVLNFEEKQKEILHKSILLLESGYGEEPKKSPTINPKPTKKPKVLRCFLYKRQIPVTF